MKLFISPVPPGIFCCPRTAGREPMLLHEPMHWLQSNQCVATHPMHPTNASDHCKRRWEADRISNSLGVTLKAFAMYFCELAGLVRFNQSERNVFPCDRFYAANTVQDALTYSTRQKLSQSAHIRPEGYFRCDNDGHKTCQGQITNGRDK